MDTRLLALRACHNCRYWEEPEDERPGFKLGGKEDGRADSRGDELYIGRCKRYGVRKWNMPICTLYEPTQEMREAEAVLKAVDRFAEAMRSKLLANLNKGGWSETSPTYLLTRLVDEVVELQDALREEDSHGASLEAVDVANFAMMIYDVLTQTGESTKDVDDQMPDGQVGQWALSEILRKEVRRE